MSIGFAKSRRVSDWIGLVCFSAFAVQTLRQMAVAGVLLIPTLVFELLVGFGFLVRDAPRAAIRSARARISAYGGTFLVLAFMLAAQRYFPQWLVPAGAGLGVLGLVLWLAGSCWTIYAIWHLRHALSIEPAARRLIVTGPYGFARHPVYTGYVAQYSGMWLIWPTWPFGLVLAVWFLLMLDRVRHEEEVLGRAFPEYQEYRGRVGAFGTVRLSRGSSGPLPTRTPAGVRAPD